MIILNIGLYSLEKSDIWSMVAWLFVLEKLDALHPVEYIIGLQGQKAFQIGKQQRWERSRSIYKHD